MSNKEKTSTKEEWKKETERSNQEQTNPTPESETPDTNNPTQDAETEATEDATVEKTTEQLLAEAQAEIEELKTRQLYKQAEFDNYRKRVLAEKTDLILNGGQKVLSAMLPVVDDLERALKNMNNTEDVAAVKEGVELIYKKFLSVLKAQGVTPIETEGADFNTDLHEAIAQIPAPTDELKGKVMDCTLKGYVLNDKVLRYAQVAVGL